MSYQLAVLAAVMGGMTLLWLLSLSVRNSSIVDIAWGPLFVVVAWIGVAVGPGLMQRRVLLAALASIWGLRLAIRIGRRNIGKPEDFRYAAWRGAAGPAWWWRSLFKVFWLQGVIALVVSLPLVAGAAGATPDRLTTLDLVGAIVWAVGFAFEAVGDFQLDRFKADPSNHGRVIQSGLWRYTRHPNYFGDALLWWGMGLAALPCPWGVVALVGPAVMTFVITRLSGVAMLERSMRGHRGWEEYAAGTGAFIPWFPRRTPPAPLPPPSQPRR